MLRYSVLSSTRAIAARRIIRAYTTAPSTFSNQDKLPRLPIPSLEATASRYLKSLQPLLTGAEYARAEKAQRLQSADQAAAHSWLEDIWLNKAYLEWREPSYINVNWFACIADNPDFPVAATAPSPGQASAVQIGRAARLIAHVLEFNDTLNKGQLEPETARGTPLCMNQYKSQFGTTRIARANCDEIVSQYPATSRHILLMYRDQAASVPVYNAHGERASLAQITAQLALAVQRIDKLLENGPLPRTIQLALETADSALFGVALDVDVEAALLESAEGCAATFCHSQAGRNRWYDKAFQIIVLSNGRAGVNGEHAPVDALTTGRIAMEAAIKERGPLKDTKPAKGLDEPAPLLWHVPGSVLTAIDKVRGDASRLAGNLRIRLGNADQFGAQWIKQLGVSPDAFFQTASLRAFLHGRTETIRSCTPEAIAFARAFDDSDVTLSRKLALFQQAVGAHIEYTRAAAVGKGIDRHLLGLRVQIRDEAEASRATLFQDPSYVQSMSFAMSTSNVSPGELFRGGFAPVIADGYGINYALDKSDLKFTVSDWQSSQATDAEQLRQTIYRTLDDLHAAAEAAKSK
ncbi:acyltransferase ChoActase/COT/CPT [Linderina pennispora]|uniref:Acyltransferase ChoActase/COT/CPT n=1 Tax=Linderina pennispora TaxID=61395 RepID=A0A1Y1W3B5_9FUNG|nr:acyltransferase ChoActase/COT/CPT [Linderina pennispora]ORX67957.1 acyltransferase ChoActase/COT/CPT [Linderina pennispora]